MSPGPPPDLPVSGWGELCVQGGTEGGQLRSAPPGHLGGEVLAWVGRPATGWKHRMDISVIRPSGTCNTKLRVLFGSMAFYTDRVV